MATIPAGPIASPSPGGGGGSPAREEEGNRELSGPGTGAAPPNNLTSPLTSFVGREEELSGITSSLTGETRLVTLTGPGGVGKTRTAIEAARRLLSEFEDGAWLIDIAPLAAADLVPAAVAAVLSIREPQPESITEAIARQLEGKRLLIVLDNCEHMRDASARLVRALLERVPSLRILATSREPLAIDGEVVRVIGPLATPAADEEVPIEAVERYPALRLWRERAVLVRPGFAFTAANAPMAIEICRHLDGLPLAIELAASRLSAMTAEQILARIAGRVGDLRGRDGTRDARQHDIRSLVDWSYRLLDPAQQQLFRRLSVFSGSWEAGAAVRVCGDPGDGDDEVVDRLADLVDRSLVVFEERDGAGRYRYLETIRAYAREKLDESGEAGAMGSRHRGWCLLLAVEGESNLRGPQQKVWLSRLDAEMPNLRGALSSSLETDPDVALQLAGTLMRFWWLRGFLSEGRRWLDEAVAAGSAGPEAAQALALYGAGILAHAQADYAAAVERLNRALSLYESVGDTLGRADAITALANVAWRQGNLRRAAQLHGRSLAVYREANDDRRVAAALNNLGLVLVDSGDYATARGLYEESLAMKQRLGDELGALSTLHNLGIVASHEGDYQRALDIQMDIAQAGRRLGDKRAMISAWLEVGGISLSLGRPGEAVRAYGEALDLTTETSDRVRRAQAIEGLTVVAVEAGHWEIAAELWGTAQEERRTIGAPPTPADQELTAPRIARMLREMGEARVAAARARASARGNLSALISELQASPWSGEDVAATRKAGAVPTGITAREAEILGLVALGLTNQEIAERLVVSVRTVETHLGNVYGKIGARGRADAAAFAVRTGLATTRGSGRPS